MKLAQATRAQALCEPAPNDATKSIANFKTSFIGYFKHQIQGICAINYLPQLTFSAMEYLGS
jgi:hypothetical protein